MPFPSLIPTGRQFSLGDYPVKTVRAQSGAETRILYGNRRTGTTLELSFDNISDIQAQLFTSHYDEVKGSFVTFALPSSVRAGWSGAAAALDAATGNLWRYDAPPAITSIRPGVSSVQVKLIGVL